MRILKETCQRTSIEIFENQKIKKIMQKLVTNKSHVVYDVICEEHLAIFYPLPFFELETINSVMGSASDILPNASKYLDLTFHWITLKQIADDDFASKFISAFDFQIIAKSAKVITTNLIGDQKKSLNYRNPDYAVITCDNRPHLQYSAELLFMGQLVDSDERWEFYSAINIEKPSKEELKYLKGIIISSSNQTVKNAKLKEKDEAISGISLPNIHLFVF